MPHTLDMEKQTVQAKVEDLSTVFFVLCQGKLSRLSVVQLKPNSITLAGSELV